ncbi:MAG: hypothetical protein WA510_27220 [Acidobacteriaceae bacterium]
MKKIPISLAAAATLVLSSPLLLAQAKPNPYEGVSAPPADDITTSQQAPATPPAAAIPAPAPAAQAQPPVSKNNPDAGIVETPLPPSADDSKSRSAALRGRGLNDHLDDDIVTSVPAPPNALPEGTVFKVRISDDIDAASSKPNAPFKGTVAENILRNGKVVIPVGSELHGRVIYATAGNRLNGGSVIHLRPDEFVLPDGTRYHLHAQVIDTLGSDTRTKGEGNIVANEHGKRTVAELGMGAGSGAIIGAAVGGGVGAVVGTAVGAGVVTAHWLRTNWSANLPANSTVVFSLTDPMTLNPVQDQKTELLPQTLGPK